MAAPKRKRSAVEPVAAAAKDAMPRPPSKRQASARNVATAAVVNPDINRDVLDAPNATRASPDADVNRNIVPGHVKTETGPRSESPLSDIPDVTEAPQKTAKPKGRAPKKVKNEDDVQDGIANLKAPKSKKANVDADDADPEAEGDEEPAGEEEVKEASLRPPPVNSEYLPLPWKGRLGYACLNTYLRNSNPPVFSSRTCRIQSILEHRHPLQDPSQPEHPTKNRPDKSKPADVQRGQRYVENLCLANVRDIEKMIRWNDRYNIKFLRLSSEMFPFASHPEYGYKLAPFAADALAQAGRVIAQHGHRVTTHPGQFTQLGSPRKPVIENAIRDLEYHDELLTLLKLPEQQNRDAVMILHMGGMFESKEATLQRFKENYANLSQSIKNRLVLENDDMGWSVHDILPTCEELNIPMVLDFHHHNIVFNADELREGTKDIMELFPRIKATWDRKGIRQKMHYSEPTPPAITPSQRRKHSPRVATLPPCPPDMDLMIEAKDKEQAVFELMRTFKLPGYDTFADIIPYTRNDDNKVALATMNKKKKKTEEPEPEPELVPGEEVGMGGPEGRVYWPPSMEEWLRPKKREVKKKEPTEKSPAQIKKEAADAYAQREAEKRAAKDGSPAEETESDPDATPATKKAKAAMRKKAKAAADKQVAQDTVKSARAVPAKKTKSKKEPPAVPTPETSDDQEEFELDDEDEEPRIPTPKRAAPSSRKPSRRTTKGKVDYNEDQMED